MKLLKIGIACYPTFGGSGVVATELGFELAQRGHQVHVVSYAPPVRLAFYHPNVHFHEVEVSDYPLFEYPPYSLALASHLYEVAVCQKLDLFHVHYAIPHAASAYLAQQMLGEKRIPIVTTLHGTDVTLVGKVPSFLPITRFSLEKSDAITAVSEFLRNQTLELFGVKFEISVVPNFVRSGFVGDVKPRIRRRDVAESNEAILLHVSNFRPVKRINDVIAVFAEVRRQQPAKLLLVGDGPERAAAERQAHELGLEDLVYFLGMQLDVAEIMGLADLLLMPSETESFGLTALEANASRVPVICARVGGLPEVIVDGETGFLLPVGDVAGMARQALLLLENPSRRLQMGEAGRQRALSLFSAERIVAAYLSIYNSVL